jgi:hypothetical protein
VEVLGLIHCGGATFIDHWVRRPSSGASTRRRRIGRLAALHRAASCPRKKKVESVFGLGCGAVVLGRLDGLRRLGCGHVGFLSFLFLFLSFLFFVLFPVCCFGYAN